MTAACMLVRRRDAEAAGLLDERYFMYCEDVDFCAAVRANGGKVYFTPRRRSFTSAAARGAPVPGRPPKATAAASWRSIESTTPGWAPLLKAYLAVRGKLPGKRPIRGLRAEG